MFALPMMYRLRRMRVRIRRPCGAFMVFALISSFVIPRRKPNFPGGRGVWPYRMTASDGVGTEA